MQDLETVYESDVPSHTSLHNMVVFDAQNHTESQNVRGWNGPLWVI